MRIFATDQNGNKQEITDLYWFEENYVHDFSGHGRFTIEIINETPAEIELPAERLELLERTDE